MTKERIKAKLDVVEAVMNLYESWFLSGDTESLAKMHNLVAKPLLVEIGDSIDEIDRRSEVDLMYRFAKEKLRSMVCCQLFGEMDAASRALSIVAADGDAHIACLVDNDRELGSACEMADDVLSLVDEWESLVEGVSFGRLVRIFHERLSELKAAAEHNIAEFEAHRAELAKRDDCEVDEYALEQHKEQISLCADILSDLEAWLADNSELDPGTDFLTENNDGDDKSGDDHDDEGKTALHGIGIAVLNGRDLLKMLFGDDDEEEGGEDA